MTTGFTDHIGPDAYRKMKSQKERDEWLFRWIRSIEERIKELEEVQR